MTSLKSLCVYCGSSSAVDPAHQEAARALGREAAKRGVEIVFGGGRVGLMGLVADGALEAGGKVLGIIPHFLDQREVGHSGVTEMIRVDSMHTRKRIMFERSDAFCALPGGLGTLDETIEIATWKQLTLHDKPLILVNIGGFWDPFLRLLEHQVREGYVRESNLALFTLVESVEAVFEAAESAPEPAVEDRPGRT